MTKRRIHFIASALTLACITGLVDCKDKVDTGAEAPPPAKVVQDVNVANWAVEAPSKYPLVQAAEYDALSQLQVTGTVNPDIARTVPVISLATGRVVEIKARLGDEVKKGQILLRIRSDDMSGGFATYQSAVADETLARAQWERRRISINKAPSRSTIYRLPKTQRIKRRSRWT